MRMLLTGAMLLCISTAASADSSTTPGGYTTLQPTPTLQRINTAPQYVFVSGMAFSNCCCGSTSFIAGAVITVPSIESTRQSWGTNG